MNSTRCEAQLTSTTRCDNDAMLTLTEIFPDNSDLPNTTAFCDACAPKMTDANGSNAIWLIQFLPMEV